MKRTERGNEMAHFANALRNFLDMEPLYQVGRDGKRPRLQDTEVERFYPHHHTLPSTSTSKRASS